MAPIRSRQVGNRHLLCGNCRSWIQYDSSGCGKTCAETRGRGIRVYVYGVQRSGGFGERSGRTEVDGERHEGDG